MRKGENKMSERPYKAFITGDRDIMDPGDLYLDPKTYCNINIKVKVLPKKDCVCEWIETDHDDWAEWKCSKCGAHVSAELWD